MSPILPVLTTFATPTPCALAPDTGHSKHNAAIAMIVNWLKLGLGGHGRIHRVLSIFLFTPSRWNLKRSAATPNSHRASIKDIAQTAND
jgi:hypothetical protein